MYLFWILTLVIAMTEAIDMSFTRQWKPNFGWELLCSWSFPDPDHLLSVRFTRDKAQFMIFRPQNHGQRRYETFHTQDTAMSLECIEQNSRAGMCLLKIEPVKPPVGITKYTCEVSGERPTFIMRSKDFDLEPYVPSIEANLVEESHTSDRVVLNCSAAGLPAPDLTLLAGSQTLAPDFTGINWNSTSKLFHVWSTVALTQNPETEVPVACYPVQNTSKGVKTGTSAEFVLPRSSGVRTTRNITARWQSILISWLLIAVIHFHQ